MAEEAAVNCDVLGVRYPCDILSVRGWGIPIASDNTPVTATFPEGSVIIKELAIPSDNQSGYYTVVMSFKTDHPASVWADLVNQDGKQLWKSGIRRSPDRLVASFHAASLSTLKVRRFDSAKYDLTCETFEVFWSSG